MKTTEFASQLRSLLLELGFSVDDLAHVGAHSLKVTCLSWAAKFGVDRDQQSPLGYHMAPGDRTLEAYGRDAKAKPLRLVGDVLGAIASDGFDPDATRSGAFAAPTRSASAVKPGGFDPSVAVPEQATEVKPGGFEPSAAEPASGGAALPAQVKPDGFVPSAAGPSSGGAALPAPDQEKEILGKVIGAMTPLLQILCRLR